MKFDLDTIRANLLKYTRMTYQSLPKIDNPSILDVGCGSGMPSIELTNLSNGNIMAIDIDEVALQKFSTKLKKFGHANRISIKKSSLLDDSLPEDYFDIIWAEGVIHIIGFEKGMKACYRLLKKHGFLILNEVIKGLNNNMNLINSIGFKLINKIILPDDIWLKEYFEPLKKMVETARIEELTPEEVKELKKGKMEIEWFKKARPEDIKSAFYIFLKF